MTHRVAVVAPLPPAPTGVAGYALRQARRLHELGDVELFSGQRGDEPGLAVHPVSDLAGDDFDVVLYHVGNSVANLDAVVAAATGPPGAVVLHDGTLHHLLRTVASSEDAYRAALAEAHGEAGSALTEAAAAGAQGEVEFVLYDCLGPVLRRHRLIVVHSQWLARLVRRRVPEVPVAVVPHPIEAPVEEEHPGRAALGLPEDALLIGHAGLLTPQKRPQLILDALERLPAVDGDVHLVFVGGNATRDLFASELERHRAVRERVTLTSFVSDVDFRAVVAHADVLVAARSPYAGETSGALTAGFTSGTPVVTQPIGAFGEMGAEVVAFASPGGDEAGALADALHGLLSRPAALERRRRATLEFAQGLRPDRLAAELVDAWRVARPVQECPTASATGWADARPPAHLGEAGRWGYRLLGEDGAVHVFGTASYRGSRAVTGDAAVRIEPHLDGDGYTVFRRSGPEPFGLGRAVADRSRLADESVLARFELVDGPVTVESSGRVVGDDGVVHPVPLDVRAHRLAAAAAAPDGRGFWLVSDQGVVFGVGSALHLGALDEPPRSPIVDMSVIGERR